MYSYIVENENKIKQKIKFACTSYNRNIAKIKILPVTKRQPLEKIKQLYDLGYRSFGENYFQEIREKKELLLKDPRYTNLDIDWIFIGQLQSNKIQNIVANCTQIQTVSKTKHLDYISKYALKYNKTPYQIYINVNLANEESKAGILLDEVDRFMKTAKSYKELDVLGLMAIPNKEILDPVCKNGSFLLPIDEHQELSRLQEFAHKHTNGSLSLGMSNDIITAIKYGSTMLRIGSALLGKRMD